MPRAREGDCPIPTQADAASRQRHPMAASLSLLILHSLSSYCSSFPSHSSSLLSNISGARPRSVLGAADDRWPVERLLPARPSTSSSASAMHGFVHDQCENFSFFCIFGFMHDQCESLRDGESVRERADFDPTVPPPHPICSTIQSTRFATLKLNLPKSHGECH